MADGLCCQPDCSGRQCGADPVCGTSCGEACNDHNQCTSDSCSNAGHCAYSAIADQGLLCSDWALQWCSGGVLEYLSCIQVCIDAGYNYAQGCDGQALHCSCSTIDPPGPCTVGQRYCTNDSNGIIECQSAEETGASQSTWLLFACSESCQSSGYDVTTGCDFDANNVPWCYCSHCQCGDGQCQSFSPCNESQANCSADCGTTNTACDDCLESCQGMPSCCTGYGCMCQDECAITSCTPPYQLCCGPYGDCICLQSC
jgi:hypothetical protein